MKYGSRKYGNQKVVADGILFDSKKEANRWAELKLLEKAGEIRNLDRQYPFILIPVQRDEKGKMLERECRYVADFVYLEKKGNKWVQIVEDTKGFRTPDYIIKRKLLLYNLGIRIREV